MDSAVLVCTQKTSGRVYEKRGTAVAKAGGQEGTESCPALLGKYVLRGVGLSEAGTGMTAGKCVPLRLGALRHHPSFKPVLPEPAPKPPPSGVSILYPSRAGDPFVSHRAVTPASQEHLVTREKSLLSSPRDDGSRRLTRGFDSPDFETKSVCFIQLFFFSLSVS